MEKQRRMRNKSYNKRWTKEDTLIFLHRILENKNEFEKPSAQIFYKKLIDEEVSLAQYSWIEMRDRMRYLKVKYKDATMWRDNTRTELSDENSETAEEHILKLCPFFKEIDEILGGGCHMIRKPNSDDQEAKFVPPISFDSTCSISTSPEETEEQLESPPLPSLISCKESLIKNPSKRSIKAPLDYLVEMHEAKSKYLAERLKFDEIVNKRKIEFSKEKLELEREKLKLEREWMQMESHLKQLEIERNYELEIERLKRETEIKKIEIEMKYKTND